jgi:hypothetical protein
MLAHWPLWAQLLLGLVMLAACAVVSLTLVHVIFTIPGRRRLERIRRLRWENTDYRREALRDWQNEFDQLSASSQ